MEQDRREFEEFYAAARDHCLQVVVVSVGDRHLADDLVAEAFTRAWGRGGRCAGIRRRVPGWCGPRSTCMCPGGDGGGGR